MGYAQSITGHVATVTRGIGVSNARARHPGTAQRRSRLHLGALGAACAGPDRRSTRLPPGVPLVAGMTATVTIRRQLCRSASRLDAVIAAVKARLAESSRARPPGPTASRRYDDHGRTDSSRWKSREPGLIPGQINPGLAPG